MPDFARSGVLSNAYPVIFILVLAIIIAAVIIAFLKLTRKKAGNRRYPVLQCDASVFSKREQAAQSGENARWFVSFKLPNEELLELRVAQEEYEQLFEGNRGKVTFQGEEFVSFVEMGEE